MAGAGYGTRPNGRKPPSFGGPPWRGATSFVSGPAKTPLVGAGGGGCVDRTSTVQVGEVKTDEEVSGKLNAEPKTGHELVASLEEQVRSAAEEILNDGNAQIREAAAGAERWIAEARRKDNDRVIDRNTVYAGLLAEQVVLLRLVGRDSCTRHGWARQVGLREMRVDDEYEVCDKCTKHCGGTLEEFCVFAAGLVELGTWNAEQMLHRKEKIGRGVCCGRT
jgi:hypothetical protein